MGCPEEEPALSPEPLTVEIVDSVGAVPAEAWDALLGPPDEASPFLQHRFLRALEEAGTLGPDTGWIPRIPLVKRGDVLVAAAPAYVKLHSQGEFVFDFSWAHFAEQAGLPYYPKLLVGVPFTPVTGRRLLTREGEDRPALMAAMGEVFEELCRAMDLSSVHVNFACEDEVAALVSQGYLHKLGIQYHWRRHGERSFEEYLGRFNSKRRNQLRRERRGFAEQGLSFSVHRGAELDDADVKTAFRIYKTTVDKFYWGRQYLNLKVFQLWAARMGDAMELVAARDANGAIVAGAVNFASSRRLFGRYWGTFQEVRNLHFEVCYYRGIEEALERGLDVFEPGAGGEHKLVRGFEPTLMHSAHLLVDQRLHGAIGRHLEEERRRVRQEQMLMMESLGQRRG
ncbi:MAG: GNAT family N-acetyltransferase [Deltaproteobacteria bacterium]|nr:GNAT family N-acetyltransferase [Deltaproteobacteria bacterium]